MSGPTVWKTLWKTLWKGDEAGVKGDGGRCDRVSFLAQKIPENKRFTAIFFECWSLLPGGAGGSLHNFHSCRDCGRAGGADWSCRSPDPVVA